MGLKIEVDLDIPIVELIDKHIPFMGDTREEVIATMTKSWLLEEHGIHELREMLGMEPMIKRLKTIPEPPSECPKCHLETIIKVDDGWKCSNKKCDFDYPSEG